VIKVPFVRRGKPPFENLYSLWGAEDELISWATDKILEKSYLIDHVDLISAYMDCVEATRKSLSKTDRHYALGGLFLRTFDSMGHALRAAMSGNYTGCVMYVRDLIETQFLLSYLIDDDARPLEWLRSDTKALKTKFKPVHIREALDARDGFLKKRRAKHYDLLSNLGAHPTPHSFEMKLDGTRKLNSGPFKQAELLDECIQEIARAAVLLGETIFGFCKEFSDGDKISSKLSLTLQRTREKYLTDQ